MEMDVLVTASLGYNLILKRMQKVFQKTRTLFQGHAWRFPSDNTKRSKVEETFCRERTCSSTEKLNVVFNFVFKLSPDFSHLHAIAFPYKEKIKQTSFYPQCSDISWLQILWWWSIERPESPQIIQYVSLWHFHATNGDGKILIFVSELGKSQKMYVL